MLSMILLVWLIVPVLGSWGDVDPSYQRCLKYCINNHCSDRVDEGATASHIYKPPLAIFSASCEDLCLFGCIEQSSQQRQASGLRPTKYYGHWPFIRYFGLEEPASVLFSLLNAVPHLLHVLQSPFSNQRACYMTRWLQAYACAACIAWTCSAVYHSRKTSIATHLDLVSALGFIASGLFIAARRIRGTSAQPLRFTALFWLMLLSWAVRAYFMVLGKVSFTSHMVLSISLVVVTTLLWVSWILHTLLFATDDTERQSKYLCLLCQFWLIIASALEIFDFPPIAGVFDAHSLWHAATVPLGFLWYRFWALDRPVRIAAEEAMKSKASYTAADVKKVD